MTDLLWIKQHGKTEKDKNTTGTRKTIAHETVNQEMIEGIKRFGKKKRGRENLIRYLRGNQLTQRQAIHAFCYHCSGYGEEEDCGQNTCPLYPYAPYSSDRRIVKRKKDPLTASTQRHSIQNRVLERH